MYRCQTESLFRITASTACKYMYVPYPKIWVGRMHWLPTQCHSWVGSRPPCPLCFRTPARPGPKTRLSRTRPGPRTPVFFLRTIKDQGQGQHAWRMYELATVYCCSRTFYMLDDLPVAQSTAPVHYTAWESNKKDVSVTVKCITVQSKVITIPDARAAKSGDGLVGLWDTVN